MLASTLPLGPFFVDDQGALTFRTPELRPCFSFCWRNRWFSARLGVGEMAVSGIVAEVPSTVAFAARRDPAFQALASMRSLLPKGWTLRLAPDHRVHVETEQPMEWPAHTNSLLRPIVGMLLTLAPYLDLLEEQGLSVRSKR